MGVLNFNTDKLITGVNIIDGNLYWTDNNSEPKKLEIDVFRDYDHSGLSTRTGDNYVIESDLSVIRLHPWKPITLDLEEYTSTATQPEPPFEQIFPRFSYRWRFEDGQYSPYAPFTQAAFIPETRTADSDEENYTEGFNTTLYNNVGTINLNNIPRGPRDVVAVQLLYTESISATIYTLETIDIPEAQRGLDYILSGDYVDGNPFEDTVPNSGDYIENFTLLPLSYSLSARKIYSALPANQLNRPYDEVPQRALAQEITANRLIYGNYQIGFDQPDALALTSELVSAGTGDGLHVKGNRTYEIGVAYIDAYGRQGSMVTAGSITAPDGTITEQIPLQSNFAQTTREQIEVTITSDPPSWADRYRYFIKDPSMDHHNLISYNIYNEGSASESDSEHVWIEFLSTDRNKVFDNTSAVDGSPGTVLVLRRSGATTSTTKARFLVQDIENEAPTEVRNQLASTDVNTTARSIGLISGSQFDTINGTTSTASRPSSVPAGSTTYYLRDENTGNSATALLNQLLNTFNGWISDNQPDGADKIELLELHSDTDFTIADLTIAERPLLLQVKGQDDLVQLESIKSEHISGSTDDDDHVITFEFGNRWSMDPDTEVLTRLSTIGLPETVSTSGTDNDPSFRVFTTRLSDEALERLQGRFWVRAARNGLTTIQSSFDDKGEIVMLQPHWFETEPAVAESQLDLFWESSETFCVCTQHGWANKLDWFNCVAEVTTGGVYLESTRINDKFNTVQLVRGVRANIPTDRNEIIERPYGLTWSGIYNSRTSVNRLNQFITEDGITKELEPNYGSLQKLHTRDTNLIALCEDKVFRIQADKDVLFNADGGGNVSASNNVLGQTIPIQGEYGISKNPESFASYGHNTWFSDAKRGVMIQFTPGNGQLFEISKAGMNDFFRDRLHSASKIVGMYDDYSDAYVVSVQGYNADDAIIDPSDLLPGESGTSNVTLKYETAVEGWPSFLSYIPEEGVSLNNKFFTWKEGLLYMHNSNDATIARNQFYTDDPVASEIQVIFNDQPSTVKEFLTLGYEGTAGWEVTNIDTESQDASIGVMADWPFKSKEGKFFKPIVADVPSTYVLDPTGTYEGSDGQMYRGEGTKQKSGIKGFYNNVTLTNDSTDKAELFAINTENYLSSN